MKYFQNIIVALICLAGINTAQSCSILPSSDAPNWGEIAKGDSIRYLVKHSEIYLATAISKKTIYNHMAKFTFRVDKVMRGVDREIIQLEGADLDFKKDFYKHSFHEQVVNHAEPEFWSFLMDSGADFGDCTNKGFYRIGMQYLLFINTDSLRRSFEPIRSQEDIWLQTIQQASEFQNHMEQYESEIQKP